MGLSVASALACGGDETIGQRVDRHIDEAKQAGEQALYKTGDAITDNAKKAGDWVAEKHASGELTDSALSALKSVGDGVSEVVSRGKQLAPVAVEIGKVLYAAVDKDVDIEPIYQAIDDEAAMRELDESIHDMPRVETIDGVEVGFKDVSSTDAGTKSSESAYLVVWRQGENLVGFVYRSKTDVNLEQLIAEAPRLVALAQAASSTEPT